MTVTYLAKLHSRPVAPSFMERPYLAMKLRKDDDVVYVAAEPTTLEGGYRARAELWFQPTSVEIGWIEGRVFVPHVDILIDLSTTVINESVMA